MSSIRVQFPPKLEFLRHPKRYKVAWGGRGAAKSWGFARQLLIDGAQQPLRILCTREIQNSIADSVHKLLADQVEALGLGGFYDVLQNTVRGANGTEFIFAGLRQQSVQSIKSFEGIDRCWVEEAQAVSERSWSILTPTIRKPDSEIWVSFNPELDTDPTYTRFVVSPPTDAAVVQVNWHDNPWFPAVLEQERLDCQRRDPEGYANIWEGKPRSVVEGAIYRDEIQSIYADGRFRSVPYDPVLRCHTVWDLGWNDQTSVIFVQRQGSELRLIDYIEDNRRTLADYVNDIETRKWAWGQDWLPHDGAAKSIQTGTSPEEVLRKLGRSPRIIPAQHVEIGIKQARLTFPRCWFDTKTARLLDCLKRYRRVVNQNTREPGAPLHDEHSHGADAFRMLALCADKLSNHESKGKPIEYPAVTGII